jgi:glycosyltransferase involved in cell wall biosynthesis/archaellum component FlaC
LNILFANYGDFATSSLNHIAGFANELSRRGHACIVAVPRNPDSVRTLNEPLFIPRTFEEVLAIPNHFPDSQPAEIIHAWTPRESVRRFVEAYEQKHPVPVLVHLEDNEEHLLESYYRISFDELRQSVRLEENPIWTADLSHPNRFRSFLHLADGATLITPSLADFLSPETPRIRLNPPVDLDFFSPRPADPSLRDKLGLRKADKVVVYHGSVTSANRGDLRKLFLAISLLNRDGIPTRLIRTGFSDPDFEQSFGYNPSDQVIDLGYIDRSKLPELLALADVLVQPGCDDRFNKYRLPSKIPEFLASGRPVIIPRTNIGLELTHEREVLLLERGDPIEIAESCRRIFSDPDLARRLGENAASTARERFDSHKATDTLFDFYQWILEQRDDPKWSRLAGKSSAQFSLLPHLVDALPSDQDGTLEAGSAKVLREAVRTLEVERNELMARLKQADDALADLTRKNGEQAVQMEEMTSRISDLKRQIETIAADREEVRNDARQAHESSRQLDRQLEEISRQLDRQLEDTNERIEQANDRLGAARQEIDRLTEREARVKATASWKLTAPLRFLRRTFIDPFTRRH